MKQYAKASEIAALMGVGSATIRRWARENIIPSMRVTGRVLRFDPEAVERALRRCEGYGGSRG